LNYLATVLFIYTIILIPVAKHMLQLQINYGIFSVAQYSLLFLLQFTYEVK